MHALSESLLNKSFAECSPGELRQLTEQYPYFAPAHFLLLKKLDPATDEYRRQYQQALLYFHDPLSFELLLHREATALHAAPEVPPATAVVDVELETVPADLPLPAATADVTEGEVPAPEALAMPTDETEADADDTEPLPAPTLSLDLNAPPTGDLSFEPFHTVDYFASQGIRLSAEEVPRDKFGKQLKSFTDWLKTMKRLPDTPAPESLDAKTEQRVEGLAGDSVQETEIVTESMAEVWLKQGNKRKAAAIYRKLSLLHPAKSAYFVAKINSLND